MDKQDTEKPHTESIFYNGKKYNRYPNSKSSSLRRYYYRHDKWKESPVALHRQIWIDNHGPIPEGWDIHHKDGNPDNNSIENLEALPPKEHRNKHPMSEEARAAASERTKRLDPLGKWRAENPELAHEQAVKNGYAAKPATDAWRAAHPDLDHARAVATGKKRAAQRTPEEQLANGRALQQWHKDHPEEHKRAMEKSAQTTRERAKKRRQEQNRNRV